MICAETVQTNSAAELRRKYGLVASLRSRRRKQYDTFGIKERY